MLGQGGHKQLKEAAVVVLTKWLANQSTLNGTHRTENLTGIKVCSSRNFWMVPPLRRQAAFPYYTQDEHKLSNVITVPHIHKSTTDGSESAVNRVIQELAEK